MRSSAPFALNEEPNPGAPQVTASGTSALARLSLNSMSLPSPGTAKNWLNENRIDPGFHEGISNKAIEHFAAKSSNGTDSSPVKATLAFDATDINANKRIDKDGRGGYVIVGGEGAGDLVEATGVSDS